MGFDPIVRNALIYLRCYNAVRVELTTRTAHVATTLVCHLSLVLGCSQNAGFLGIFYQTYYNAVRVELTTRTALVAIRMIVTVTEGGEEPTGAGLGPSCEGDELSGG